MCSPASEKLVDEVLAELVAARKPFTALNVSLAVKKKGGTERHRDMKNYIHQATSPLIGSDVTWNRVLIRPKGAPIDAWLYYPTEFDPKDFGKDEDDDPNQPIGKQFVPAPVAAAADGGAVGPHVSAPNIPWGQSVNNPGSPLHGAPLPSTPGSSQPRQPKPPGSVAANANNRLCVPKRILRDLGLKPGDTVNIVVDQGGGEIRLSKQPDPAAKRLCVDVRQTVRISPRTLSSAGMKAKFYKMDRNNDVVTITKVP